MNPLGEVAVEFISIVLSLKRHSIIPITAVVRAYLIVTKYLKVNQLAVKKILIELLRTRSPALYPNIPVDIAIDCLDYAIVYDIESWGAI